MTRAGQFLSTLLFSAGVVLILAILLEVTPAQANTTFSYAREACTSSERWNFSKGIDLVWQKEFNRLILNQRSSVQGFSEALALRRRNLNTENSSFAEYWLARSLFRTNLVHIAFNGFAAIAKKTTSEKNFGVQMAALSCLTKIRTKHPSLEFPKGVAAKLKEFKGQKSFKLFQAVIWDASSDYLRYQLAANESPKKLLKTLEILKNSGARYAFHKGLYYARVRNHRNTIKWLTKYQTSSPQPKGYSRYQDSVKLLLSRAYYSTGKYKLASIQLKSVDKNSNELAETLSELSWSYLLADRYPEAIGTALNLQMGVLRRTFSPETPMVMAMALNEICQFPKAEQAVGLFRHRYRKSYEWLSYWKKNRKKLRSAHYQEAINYLRDTSKVPDKVAGEWVRSSRFLSRQDEINLIFKEKKLSGKLGSLGAKTQTKLAGTIVAEGTKLLKQYKKAKIQLKPGQKLPNYLIRSLEDLRTKMVSYQRLRAAAPIWNKILNGHKKTSRKRTTALMAKVNSEIDSQNLKMLQQLNEIAENNYFIEVEVYNGASKDIIWKNSYPDYEQVAEEIKNKTKGHKKSQVWSWGNFNWSESQNDEIWEDELGSFKADLYNNCSSKDQYLALKRERAIERARRAAAGRRR